MREDGAVPPRLVEIAVVATSAANGCKYCVGHHGPALKEMGLAAATVDRILEPDVPGLDEVERVWWPCIRSEHWFYFERVPRWVAEREPFIANIKAEEDFKF